MTYELETMQVFPSYFYQLIDNDFSDYQEGLISWLTEYSERNESVLFSNFGGYQSDPRFLNDSSFEPYTSRLNMMFAKVISSCLDRPHLKAYPSYQMTSCWFNINGKGDHNLCHCHPDSDISAVFWVQGDSGNLIFPNPNLYSQWATFRDEHACFTPEPGVMIVFPSCMNHFVEPNESDTPRISIAANFKLNK